jgi:hypothetical protein
MIYRVRVKNFTIQKLLFNITVEDFELLSLFNLTIEDFSSDYYSTPLLKITIQDLSADTTVLQRLMLFTISD